MEFTATRAHQRRPLELFFDSLRDAGRGLSFPCDAAGRVDLDSLSEADRRKYLYARVVTGNELAWPVVRPAGDRPVLVS